MLSWLSENLTTIILTLILTAVVVLIIVKMIRDKRQGKTSCSGNCASCGICKAKQAPDSEQTQP